MKIEIEKIETDSAVAWTVRVGDRWEDGLTFEEAIGCVAKAMLLGPDKVPFIQSDEQHAEWDKLMGEKRAKRAAADAAKG